MKKLFTLLIMMVCMTHYVNCQDKFSAIGKIDTELLEEINNSSRSDDLFRVIIVMSEHYDAVRMTRQTQFMDKTSKREFVINEMKDFTKSSQFEVVNFLNSIKSPTIKNVQQYWVFNGISCEASADIIALLAKRPDIEMIYSDKERNMLPEEWKPEPVSTTRGNSWNVTKVNADDVWNYNGTSGFTGEGVVVAVIDSGVNYNHNDIKDNMWDGGTTYPNHGYDWVNGDNDPMDDNGHGSHCAGTIAGNGTSGTQTGIAPDAKIMALKTLSSGGTGSSSNIISAMEFALDNGANVISMSLGSSGNGGLYYYRDAMITVMNAGVIASVAAGNDGDVIYNYPVPYNIGAPGNCPPPWLNPDQANILSGGTSAVMSIGATDQNDTKTYFSSVGPATWTKGKSIGSYNDYPYTEGSATEIGLIRPDVAAPGYQITSLDYSNNSGYTNMNGTSMATPCVAGVMALLLEADNTLTPAAIDSILETTAVPCGGYTKKNNYYGAGRVDALAAIDAIIGLVPPSDFTATPVNDNDVQMSWTETTDAVSYKVYRDGVEIADITTTSYTDTSLDDGIYQYSVSAVYSVKESFKTKPVEIQVGDGCAIIFSLFDSYDSWNGKSLTASFSNGAPSVDYTIETGDHAQYTLVVPSGIIVTLTFNSNYSSSVLFNVAYKNGDIIYESIRSLSAGFITSFVSCPSEYLINTENEIQNGSITVAESALEGSEVTVSATPDSGYGISSLYYYTTNPDEKTYIDIETMKFVMPSDDITIGGVFDIGIYSITINSEIVNGIVSTSHVIGNEDNIITVSATPDEGCVLGSLSYKPKSKVVHYDNGFSDTNIGNMFGNPIHWGIMIPSSDLASYSNYKLSKVRIYDNLSYTGKIKIYKGGSTAPETLLHQQAYTCTGAGKYIEVELDQDIMIDISQNLWIVLNNDNGSYPAAGERGLNNPNGRWISTNGTTWYDIVDNNPTLNYTWNIQGVFQSTTVETTPIDMTTMQFSMPASDVMIDATFDEINYLTLYAPESLTSQDIPIEIGLENRTTDLTAIQFDIVIPDVQETWFSDLTNLYLSDRFTNAHTGFIDKIEQDKWRVIIYSSQNAVIDGNTGTIVTLTIPGEHMTAGSRTISLENVILGDVNSVDRHTGPLPTLDINVYDLLLGDADGNGSVNVNDVTQSIYYILGNNPTPFYFAAADVNYDEAINVLDVTGIVFIILGINRGGCDCTEQYAYYYVENGILYLETPVDIAGIQFDYSNLSADISTIGTLPKFEYGCANGRYIIYSTDGTTIKAGKHALLRVGDNTLYNMVISDANACEVRAVEGMLSTEDMTTENIGIPYPNPFHNMVTIPLNINENAKDVRLIVTNIMGQTVDVVEIDNYRGDYVYTAASDMKAGIYQLTLRVDGCDMKTVKIVKYF